MTKQEEIINGNILHLVTKIKERFPFGKLTILINGHHGPDCDHNVLVTEDHPEAIRQAVDRLEKELDVFRGEAN